VIVQQRFPVPTRLSGLLGPCGPQAPEAPEARGSGSALIEVDDLAKESAERAGPRRATRVPTSRA
jgi:hypothetical protein